MLGAAFAPRVKPVKAVKQHGHAQSPTIQFVKTRLCKHFTKGYCKFEDHCFFAHELNELVLRPDLTKTKLCHTFMSTGACPNDCCSFAHGVEDLRPVGGVYVPPALGHFKDSFMAARETMSASKTSCFANGEPEYIVPTDLKTRRGSNKGSFEAFKTTNKQREAPVKAMKSGDTEDVHSTSTTPTTPTSTEEIDHFLDPLEPVLVNERAVPSRWLLMLERLLCQRRREMVHHGRMLLNKSQRGLDMELSRTELDNLSAILLQEPGWCVEFKQLARRIGQRLQLTTPEPGDTLQSACSDSPESF